MDCLVTLDAGTGSGRCMVLDLHGRPVASAQEPLHYRLVVDPDMPMIRGFDLDAAAFWGTLARCARAALGRLPADARVRGVIATSQREGCVFSDRDGEVLYAGPNLDARAAMEGIEAQEVIAQERLHAITGHVPPYIFALPRLLWFRKHGDFARIATVFMLNDWITFRLSGARVAEHSNAGETMLYDVSRREWSREILDAFAIPAALLPRLVPAGTEVGRVTARAAAETGLPEGTPVFAGGADTESALLGSGAWHAGRVGAVLGTTAPVQMVTDWPVIDPAGSLWTSPHVVAGQWVLEANSGDTGDGYKWLLDVLFGGTDAAAFAAAEAAIATVGADARRVFSYLGPLVFAPTKMTPFRPAGLLFPFPILHVDRPNRGELMVGFLENVAFAIRANVELVTTVSGLAPTALDVSGGLTRSKTLARRIASAVKLPVDVATVVETASVGCAILAAVGAGLHPSIADAVAAMTSSTRIDPDPVLEVVQDERYAKWREIYEQLYAIQV
ncbi:MAG: FGGY family carbohydrate kinase [Candidatus Binatia bacterium]